ncbi:reverse transcriptase domain-containing protein [Tanacetum coccineum]
MKEQIEGHLSALKSLIQNHNKKNIIDPIPLDFREKDIEVRGNRIMKGKAVVDDDLKKPFKEAVRTPLTRRIIEFVGSEYKMPGNIKLYDGTTDLEDHLSRFTSTANSEEWPMPVWCRMFQQTLDGPAKGWFERLQRACFKESHEITKIVRKANESLTSFKERWTIETGFIMGASEVMKISSFMDSLKCPELAKHFLNKAPITVDEMMVRVDDFIRSMEAFARTKLLKGETEGRTIGPRTSRLEEITNLESLRFSLWTLLSIPQRRSWLWRPSYVYRLPDPCLIPKEADTRIDTRGRGNQRGEGPQQARVINLIRAGSSKEKKRKDREVTEVWMNAPITSPSVSEEDVSDKPLIVEVEIEGDKGQAKRNSNRSGRLRRRSNKTVGKDRVRSLFGNEGLCRRTTMKFIIIKAPSPYNIILGRTRLKTLRAVPSTIHSMMKFPTPKGITTLVTRSLIISECRRLEKRQVVKEEVSEKVKREEVNMEEVGVTEEVLINPAFLDQRVVIGRGLSETCKSQLKLLLKDNIEIFVWEPADMTSVPRQTIEHTLKVNTSIQPICQKRRILAPEKNDAVVKKNLNSVCPKDYYPLPNIDCRVEFVMGFKYKCFLDAYKGYHQIQMAKEDEEKTSFYTDQGTYYYTKTPFGLKNAGATYQKLVDTTFQSQIGRNLEAYVDNMVIKSNDENTMLADVAKTFDNLRKINMNLNLKKCSFGVKERKFLGYMVTSEGIRANPKKTKALADLQSPRTLKEMQILSGNLAALNRYLAKSAERSLHFFNTPKCITKENKHEYTWTMEAEESFQQMKRYILNLSSLTPPFPKETLYAYLAVSKEAVSVVLMTDRKGRQCPIYYVSRTLNEAEKNYAPMEKLALSLIHMTRRLRRKVGKNAVELGAYNITFEPRNVVKGQVLADFISETLDGETSESYFWNPKVPLERDDTESWTLFTDRASSPKGSGAGLVLIGPSGVEYTYALWLTFACINNEAEYEALLACLRIARKMKIHNSEVKVDSKLVASQINGSYVANSNSMVKYLAKAKEYIACFKSFSIKNIPKNLNQKADVLSKLALVAINHLTKEILVEPEDKNERRNLRVKINQYVMEDGVLFKKGYLVPMLRSEAVIPAEIGMPTYRTMMVREGFNEEELRLNLDLLQERRERAAIREVKYKTKLEQYYNKRVQLTNFKPGEFVFRKNKASRVEDQGNLGPKWEGPYRVTKAY